MLGWGKPGQGRGGQESESRQDWGYEGYMAHPRCVPRFPPCPVAQLVSHRAGDLPFGFRPLCDLLENGGGGALSSERLQSPRGLVRKRGFYPGPPHCSGLCGAWGRI